MQNQTSPLILSFNVSDPVGAIGIQGDLATFSALGCHGLSVSTALLIGDSARVEDVLPADPDWVSDQARVLLEDMGVAAFKIGAAGGIEHVTAIAEIVSDYPEVPLILDPFTSALPELGIDGEDMLMALRQLLIPQASVLMLSQLELERLAETWRDGAAGDSLRADVDFLLELGCEHVLVTGTAWPAQASLRSNTLFGAGGVLAQEPWQPMAGSFLGAGGTLSGALAAYMATSAPQAARALAAAQYFTGAALTHARRLGMGKLMPERFFQRRAGA